jgi:hypothetical protein
MAWKRLKNVLFLQLAGEH